jgi:hypothetical protein
MRGYGDPAAMVSLIGFANLLDQFEYFSEPENLKNRLGKLRRAGALAGPELRGGD